MVVGGVPQASQLHCESILNLALGMVFEGKQVKVPGMNLPVRVRIAVHTGPVVAGIVSHKKPRLASREMALTEHFRYCVLGQTVVVAKTALNQSMPGKILVTNAVRTLVYPHSTFENNGDGFRMVTKHLKSIFVFTSAGFLEAGTHKILTHYLEKNEQASAWDLIHEQKGRPPPRRVSTGSGANNTIDGYKELHSEDGAVEWEEARAAAIRQQNVCLIGDCPEMLCFRWWMPYRESPGNRRPSSDYSQSRDGSAPPRATTAGFPFQSRISNRPSALLCKNTLIIYLYKVIICLLEGHLAGDVGVDEALVVGSKGVDVRFTVHLRVEVTVAEKEVFCWSHGPCHRFPHRAVRRLVSGPHVSHLLQHQQGLLHLAVLLRLELLIGRLVVVRVEGVEPDRVEGLFGQGRAVVYQYLMEDSYAYPEEWTHFVYVLVVAPCHQEVFQSTALLVHTQFRVVSVVLQIPIAVEALQPENNVRRGRTADGIRVA